MLTPLDKTGIFLMAFHFFSEIDKEMANSKVSEKDVVEWYVTFHMSALHLGMNIGMCASLAI